MRKRALVVGVNRYAEITQLNGCVNDTTDLRVALVDLAGFSQEDVRVLIDSQATKLAIEAGLAWLTDGASRDDLLVFHFSGHGSQIRDVGPQDELVDHLDEILCPCDMDWKSNFITDDYLHEHLRVPEGVVVEAILDCCNSGDGHTEISSTPPAASSPDRQPRFVTPPSDIVDRHEGQGLSRQRLLRSPRAGGLALWSGCADNQTAADARIDGVFRGAFTAHLCRHLRTMPPGTSRDALLERVRNTLRDEGFSQVPELAATAGLEAVAPFTRPT